MSERKPPKLVAPKRDFKSQEPKPAKKPNKTKKKTASKPKSGNPFRRVIIGIIRSIWRVCWWIGFRVGLLVALILAGFTGYYLSILPDAVILMDDRSDGSVTILDAEGEPFAFRGEQFGGIVTAETVSENLKNAVIATEDKRFYWHLGVSPRGIAGAIRTNLREGRKPWQGHGGSTITQQVAKRVYFEDLPALERKLREMPMSFAMELKYTKDEILAIYLNRAFLGNGSYGFAAASQRYFGKPVIKLSPAESAMLAGLLKAPSSTNPIRNLSRAQLRANLIVGLMEDQGYLTRQEADLARQHPARLSQAAQKKAGGYFADWILEAAPSFLIDEANSDVIIRTTFDQSIQDASETALNSVFQKLKSGSKAQGAIVVMSHDGAVRAMVGGRENQFAGSFNRATQALRQTGSSFKPFVYAAALESGFRYDSVVEDSPVSIKIPGQPDYEPKNYDRKFIGPMTLTEALMQSRNAPAVKISEEVGRARVQAVAQDLGVANDIPLVPAMALGAAESTLLEMTGAYAGLSNLGQSVRPYGLLELTIQGDDTPLLQKEETEGLRVINDNAAQQLTFMMNQVIESGTGRRAHLGARQAAGKTGTTQGSRDAWFIGYTADYVAGVWMGYDDNSPLTGVSGGGLPAEIWKELMLEIHKDLPLRPLQMQIPRPQDFENEFKTIEQQIQEDLNNVGNGLRDLLNDLFN